MAAADSEVDLLERARSGDRAAFRSLVVLWGDLAGSVALLIARDRVRAAAAVRDAFVEAWRELPSMHSERPFRPWLIAKTVSTATARAAEPSPDASPVRMALEAMDAPTRVAAILVAAGSLPASEVGLVLGENIGRATRRVRSALKALDAGGGDGLGPGSAKQALAAETRGSELPATFFDDAIAPVLERAPDLEVRRLIMVDRQAAWATILDPLTLTGWVAMPDVHVRGGGALRAGAHLSGRGSIAGVRASRDETLITRVEDERLLAWRTRSSPKRAPGTIEFRWSIELVDASGGTEVVHRLNGVAFPGGMTGRALHALYGKVASGMQASMHVGIERLAALIESRAGSTA